jgi:hypothetical protein
MSGRSHRKICRHLGSWWSCARAVTWHTRKVNG